MRQNAPSPAGSSLPLPNARETHRRHVAGPFELSPVAMERFNNFLHELHADAPHVDADAIASLARWLQSQPLDERQRLLDARLDRLPELEALLADEDWTLDDAQKQRIARLLDYVRENDDLIPDDVPWYGRLDDALLVELVWPMLAEELADYQDFNRYRSENRGDRPAGTQDWLTMRLEEGALWAQLHRVRERHYVDFGPPDALFHVG
ncbi:hypothetical protein [Arenimonas sp.]|uniref:hypothetical protein n=1 Tax=Arenimonas sp. TaxID=1872635 RepID=UPI0039E4F790